MRRFYSDKLVKVLRDNQLLAPDETLLRIFTNLRKNGQRRIKTWTWGRRLFNAPQEVQLKVEADLKAAYGEAYLGGYFFRDDRTRCFSFCIVLDQSKLEA